MPLRFLLERLALRRSCSSDHERPADHMLVTRAAAARRIAAFISSLPDGSCVPGGTRVPRAVTHPWARPMSISAAVASSSPSTLGFVGRGVVETVGRQRSLVSLGAGKDPVAAVRQAKDGLKGHGVSTREHGSQCGVTTSPLNDHRPRCGGVVVNVPRW